MHAVAYQLFSERPICLGTVDNMIQLDLVFVMLLGYGYTELVRPGTTTTQMRGKFRFKMFGIFPCPLLSV